MRHLLKLNDEKEYQFDLNNAVFEEIIDKTGEDPISHEMEKWRSPKFVLSCAEIAINFNRETPLTRKEVGGLLDMIHMLKVARIFQQMIVQTAEDIRKEFPGDFEEQEEEEEEAAGKK